MSKITTPYRYDFVGSFLRPQALKDAKAAFQVSFLKKSLRKYGKKTIKHNKLLYIEKCRKFL